MNNNEKISVLPFDLYQRYKLVQQVIEGLRDKKPLKILDVGGFPGQILNFLPDDDVLVIDRQHSHIGHYLQAEAPNLPFERNSFDIVTTVDVLEHIPKENRETFLLELSRVSRNVLIIACPFDTPDVSLYEILSNSFYRSLTGNDHIWLKGHIENGLPDLGETMEKIKNNFPYVSTFCNGYLPRWVKMITAHLNSSTDDFMIPYLQSLNKFYNEKFFEYDNKPISYRKIIVASKNKFNLNILEKPEDEVSINNEVILDRLIENLQKIYIKFLLTKKDLLLRRKDEEIQAKDEEIQAKDEEIQALINSWSWKITGPLRKIHAAIFSKTLKNE
jgi:hypothetical protein